MIECRYQYWGPQGLTWTKWFKYNEEYPRPKKINKLLREYREI